MKYMLYEKDQISKAMIYCDKNGNETAEDIAKAIGANNFVGKFIAEEHTATSSQIKNDNNMFVLRDIYGNDNIWQICEKVSDYNGIIVPHLYKVRKIGILFE